MNAGPHHVGQVSEPDCQDRNPDPPSLDTLPDEFFDMLAAYEEALQRGEKFEPSLWLGKHYPVPHELRAGLEELYWLHAPGRRGHDARTTPPSGLPDIPGYEILEVVDRGGMGVVYKARQLRPARIVALKMVLDTAGISSEELARFRTEPESAARLQHPNIVQVYEAGEHDGRLYFTMEFVDGGSLDKKLAGTPQPPRVAAELIETLARAVQYAHDQGVVHRDLKPANILLQGSGIRDQGLGIRDQGLGDAASVASSRTPNPQSLIPNPQSLFPKITDFGLAKRSDVDLGQTQSGAILGTPSYMAPEQASGKAKTVGPLADVYALGVLLYELLVGRPPFTGVSILETLDQVAHQEPMPPRQLQRALPRDLETICLKCLQKLPAKRYASARELADDLRRYLDGKPIQARRTSHAERAWRWCRRNPAVATLTALVMATLLGGIVVSSLFAVEAKKNQYDAELLAAEVKKTLYYSEMRLARQAWDNADPEWLGRLLDHHHSDETNLSDLRRWEWHYWQRVRHSETYSLRCSTKHGYAVAYSPDSLLLATESEYGHIQIRDARTGRALNSFSHASSGDRTLIFNLDGKTLVSGITKNTLGMWDVASGAERQRFTCDSDHLARAALSPDGRYLAAGGTKQLPEDKFECVVHVWEVSTGKQLHTLHGHSNSIYAVAFSPDGRHLASCSYDWHVKIWNLARAEVAYTLREHQDRVEDLAFSSDGKILASAGNDKVIHLWDTTRWQRLRTLAGHTHRVVGSMFSSDGRTLASYSDDKTVRLWDVASGETIRIIRGFTLAGGRFAFRPDGKQLAVSELEFVRVWDVTRDQESLALEGHFRPVHGIAFSPDGRTLASTGGESAELVGEVRLWDVATGKETRPVLDHRYSANYIAYSPDGKRLAWTDNVGGVRLEDAATGDLIARFHGHNEKNPVWWVAFSPDGTLLATGSEDSTLRIWDVESRRQCVCLDLATWTPDKKKNSNWVHGIHFSPDGRRMTAGCGDQTIRVWDTRTWKEVFPPLKGHTAAVWCAVFSPDGTKLASCSNDSTVCIWDATTGKLLHIMKGHVSEVSCVAFSPDGKRVASAGWDGTVRLWDPERGEEVLTLKGHKARVFSVAFSPDGQKLASGAYDKTIRIWDASPMTPAELQRRRPATP